MDNIGKQHYREIPVPDCLERTVAKAVRRGLRRRVIRRAGSGIAAMLAVMLLCANVPVLYAAAAEVPLLGRMVRIMRVGSGGRNTQGVRTSVLTAGTAVRLHFENPDGSAAEVPRYSASLREAPFRIVLRLHGAEDLDALTAALSGQAAVADAYPNACTVPGDQCVTIVLREGWNCSVGEYETPDVLEISFHEEPDREAEDAWYLCGEPVPFGSGLAELTERLSWEGATQIRMGDGTYRVVLGGYRTEAQALDARDGLEEKLGEPLGLTAVRCGSYETPFGETIISSPD